MGEEKTLQDQINALESRLNQIEWVTVGDWKSVANNRKKIRELEAKVAELESTDATRRLNMTTEDPEWY